jgi:hypothetical protein
MRHFVRFAKMNSKGEVDRGGWRLRIFLTPGEAGEFAETLAEQLWAVETGFYHDEAEAPANRRDPNSSFPKTPRFTGGVNGRSGGIRTHDPLSPRQVR